MGLGLGSVGLPFIFFMFGERPLGLRLFRKKTQTPEGEPSQEQTRQMKEDGNHPLRPNARS